MSSSFTKFARYVNECAAAHREHGDLAGAAAILMAARCGRQRALAKHPGHAAAIDNALAYAEQESA